MPAITSICWSIAAQGEEDEGAAFLGSLSVVFLHLKECECETV